MSNNYEIDSFSSNDRIFNYKYYIDLPELPLFYNLLQELVAGVNYCIEIPCIATGILCPTYSTTQAPNIKSETNCISILLGCLIVFPISFGISLSCIFILISLIILIILINIITLPCTYSLNFYIQDNVSNINTLPDATTISDTMPETIPDTIPIKEIFITIEQVPGHIGIDSQCEQVNDL